ncbi:MAG: hypothetical protein L3J96_05115 [Thermoplasmata archaeon]|nr:hypothetical protein [Thermoplasmata archaeon]
MTDPTVGLPILLLSATLGVWLFSNLRGFRSPELTRTTWLRPDRDAVSQTFYAIEDGRYSRLVRAVYDRCDRAVHTRYGVGLAELGWRPWPTKAGLIPERKELLQIRDSLSRRFTEAVGRELPFRFRWAFWRSPAEDDQRYLGRVDAAIARAETMVHTLERST